MYNLYAFGGSRIWLNQENIMSSSSLTTPDYFVAVDKTPLEKNIKIINLTIHSSLHRQCAMSAVSTHGYATNKRCIVLVQYNYSMAWTIPGQDPIQSTAQFLLVKAKMNVDVEMSG